MVSPASIQSPPSAQPSKKSSRPANSEATAVKMSGKPDAFKTRKASITKFGTNPSEQPKKEDGFFSKAWNTIKKVGLGTLGAASTGGFLFVGLPLGLAQMALGLFFHPLLITGALTMGIPLAGVAASYFLWPDKK